MKTYEDPAVQQNQEFNEIFGTKKLTRISKSKANDDAINVSTDIFTNISTSMNIFLYINHYFCVSCDFIL